MEDANSALTLVLALAAGVIAQSIARRLRIPGIVVLLAAGVALGPDILGWVEPRSLEEGFLIIIDLAVAVILFEGGLNLEISRLRREQASIRRLVTWGALCTLAGGALAARFIMGWEWGQAALFGSLVVVTGPTVIGPLVTELRLKPRVSTVLSAEGVLIDPVGAILAVLVLEIVIAPQSAASGARDLVLRIGFGAVAGILTGFVLAGILRVRGLMPDGYKNIFVLASILLLFEACDAVVSHSGILAVTLAGVVVGNFHLAVDRDMRDFKDQLTILLIGLLFILLAADVRYAEVAALGLPGIGVVAALILIVRPLTVTFMTLGTDLSWRERLFIGWVAPRGIVAAAIASIVAAALMRDGIPGGADLRALVFLTIVGTVIQVGLTAAPVGRWLKVRLPGREGVAILGAQGMAIALADALRAGGVPVVLFDSNVQSCRRAERAGFNVVNGNALEEGTLERGRLEIAGSAVGLTPNQTINGVFVSRARELFGVPDAYVAVSALDTGMVSEMVETGKTDVLFEDVHDVERWDVRSRHGEIEIIRCIFGAPAAQEAPAPNEVDAPNPDETSTPEPRPNHEHFAIFALTRGDKTTPMSMSLIPREGDIATVAIHIPEHEAALEILAERGWTPTEVD